LIDAHLEWWQCQGMPLHYSYPCTLNPWRVWKPLPFPIWNVTSGAARTHNRNSWINKTDEVIYCSKMSVWSLPWATSCAFSVSVSDRPAIATGTTALGRGDSSALAWWGGQHYRDERRGWTTGGWGIVDEVGQATGSDYRNQFVWHAFQQRVAIRLFKERSTFEASPLMYMRLIWVLDPIGHYDLNLMTFLPYLSPQNERTERLWRHGESPSIDTVIARTLLNTFVKAAIESFCESNGITIDDLHAHFLAYIGVWLIMARQSTPEGRPHE